MASFRKRGKTWEYRIKFTDRRTGKPDEISKGGFSSKTEAKAAANLAELKVDNFGFSENGNEVLSKFLEDWLEVYKKPNVKISSFNTLERTVRNHINPRFGRYRLKDITRIEYQKWLNELGKKYSENTIKVIHRVMNNAMASAVHDFGILYTNPINRVKMPKIENLTNFITCFTKEELAKFLDSCDLKEQGRFRNAFQYHTLFTLLSRTGLRIGECAALTWKDIDYENKFLNVDKNLVYISVDKPFISSPKTKSSIRKIMLDELTLKLLKKHKVSQSEWILKETDRKQSKENLIFHNENGDWLNPVVIRDYFKKVCKNNNLPELSPHSLRHTHAVHLIETGINIKYVSERLGHASIKTTADIYLHVTKKMESDAISQYEKYMQI